MKKSVIIISSLALLASYSCKKNTEGNKNILVEETVKEEVNNENGKVDSSYVVEKKVIKGDQKEDEVTERYVAEDGSSANITFKNSKDQHTISIHSNKMTLTLPQKDSDGKTNVYEKDGIVVTADGTNVIITQDNHEISLRKAKGQ